MLQETTIKDNVRRMMRVQNRSTDYRNVTISQTEKYEAMIVERTLRWVLGDKCMKPLTRVRV